MKKTVGKITANEMHDVKDEVRITLAKDGSLADPDGIPELEGATDKNSKRTGIIVAMAYAEDCAKAHEAAAKKK